MFRIIFLFQLSVIICSILHSQEKELTYYDLEVGRYYNLRPETLENLCWKDNHTLFYVEKDTGAVAYNPQNNKKELLLTLEDLNKSLLESGLDSLKGFPYDMRVSQNNLFFSVGERKVAFDMLTKVVDILLVLPEESENVLLAGDMDKAVYTQGQNLYLTGTTDNELQLTNDTVDGKVNGHVPHRNEFGISEGAYWSPNNQKVAYYHKDESMVSQYPLVRIDERVATLENIRYPMAGMKSEEVLVEVYDLQSRQTIALKTGGDPEQYLTNISWSPNSNYIYIQQLNREQNHMWLVQYSSNTGKVVDTLFEEKHDKYVEPLHPLIFSRNNPQSFYYQSARDGYNHIYFYDAKKAALKQLTKGKWEVTDFMGFGSKERFLYFMATAESPLERHLYKQDLKTGKLIKLTKDPGVHQVTFNDDYTLFIDQYSSSSIPNCIAIRNSNGKLVQEVLEANNPLEEYKLGQVEVGTFKSADSVTDLYYRMVKPVGFQPDKKYPVVFYVYGGPHAQMITNSWVGRTELWHQYLAEKGFIGITIDTRGSSGRGMDFENVIHRQTGIPQMKDIMKAVGVFSQKPYVDTSRIGIHGWSYGGYMTVTMMTHYPETFKVGVAGGPVIDWKYYEVMYGERYMDMPQENPEGYKLTDLNNYAGNLKGKLKIIHGSVDPTVVWQNSMSFVQACIKAGTYPDYFFYPLHEHNVRGYDRVHLIKLITDYFIENL